MSFSPMEASSTNISKNGVSNKAHSNLQQAIIAFERFRATTAPPSTTTTFHFLTPSHHLTGICWREFAAHVRATPGWLAKRREATAEEKAASLNRSIRGKTYFIDLKYSPQRAIAMVAEAAASKVSLTTLSEVASQASKRPAETDSDVQPDAKKLNVLQQQDNAVDEEQGNSRVTL